MDTCTEAELIDLLKHELIHYFLPGRGHYKDFLNKSEEVGATIGDYEVSCLIGEQEPLGVGEDKKPQWKLFMDSIKRSLEHGYFLKRLRENTSLSQEQVASEAGDKCG